MVLKGEAALAGFEVAALIPFEEEVLRAVDVGLLVFVLAGGVAFSEMGGCFGYGGWRGAAGWLFVG